MNKLMHTIFRKLPPPEYTLEIPCKIRINSKDGKEYSIIIQDLFKELISKDAESKSRYFNSIEEIGIVNILTNKLKEALYFHLEKILDLKIGSDSKKISYKILDLRLKKGSLVLTFTVVFTFIELYKNINDIIDFFLEDFSNYINFMLDQYEVTYKYYLPFNIPVSSDMSHSKNKFLKNVLFPITISITILAAAIIINKEDKEDVRRIINEELIKYKYQEKINELDNYYHFQQYFSLHKANTLSTETDSVK